MLITKTKNDIIDIFREPPRVREQQLGNHWSRLYIKLILNLRSFALLTPDPFLLVLAEKLWLINVGKADLLLITSPLPIKLPSLSSKIAVK
jgi:hypothetical protein